MEGASGKCVGIALDLYKLNGEHSEVCEYTNVVKIAKRGFDFNLQAAMQHMVDLFYRYEAEMALALEQAEQSSPGLAQAVRDVQGGTLAWMSGERGGRYSKI